MAEQRTWYDADKGRTIVTGGHAGPYTIDARTGQTTLLGGGYSSHAGEALQQLRDREERRGGAR
jgi:hypothetical protein